METPDKVINTIINDFKGSEYPVVFGDVPGDFSLAQLHEIEAILRDKLQGTRVTLGRRADALIYMINDSTPETCAA